MLNMSSSDAASSSVKVAVRVRPLNQREKALDSNVIVRMDGRQTTLGAPKYSNVAARHSGIQEKSKNKPKRFVYDYSYWSAERNDAHYTSQEQVFEDLGTLVLDAAFEGYNACVFAYGQTGAGKTYTMMGEKNDPGLIPRICKGLYGHVSNNSNQQESFRIEVSYLEIYNEQVWDLLRPLQPGKKEVPASRLKVREHPREGPYVQGLTRHDAPDNESLENFLNQGNFLRTTAATNMNDQSSRSHAIFTITFTQAKFLSGLPSEVMSKVHLVDLAGSERVSKSGATGDRLKEGGNINRSLTTLGIVISALAERSSQTEPTQKKLFIPYRDSVLTWLLKDSLGGNSKTIMIAAISPSDTSYGETLSTLRYADRAKNIVNIPTVNEDPNVKLIRELKTEIERLKSIIAGDKAEVPTSLTALENVDQAQKLLEGTENRMAKHLRVWAEKWRDTLDIIEESDLGLRKHGSALQIDVDPPHLVLLDNDPLNTSITIFSLKGGDNFIGNSNGLKSQDLVFDEEEIKSEHCVLTYDTARVLLTPKDGNCCVNTKVVGESTKLSQGDIIELGGKIKLKFNFPLEANLLKEKRRSGQFSGSTENFFMLTSSPLHFDEKRPDNQPLSPVTDESGVEIDIFDMNDEDITEKNVLAPTDVTIEVCELNSEGDYEKRTIDDLRHQVEELFAKYKESEIERFEAESKNQAILEEKDKKIHDQAKKLLELQKKDEALLQQHQNELQTVREQLFTKKSIVREELGEVVKTLVNNVVLKNNEITDMSKIELEKYGEHLNKQLQREWSLLDEYEMKLVEVEAEKKRTSNEAEFKLKKERERSESERNHRLNDIEDEKNKMQAVLESEIQKREVCRNEYKVKEKETARCKRKLERGIEVLVNRVGELDWAKYKLSRDEGDLDDAEVCELLHTVKDVSKEIESLETDNEEKVKILSAMENELSETGVALKIFDENIENRMAEFEGIRKKYAECQQQFGEELGDIVNIVYQERDDKLEKVECEKELLMSQHLEHQIALELLVNEGFEKIGGEDQPGVRNVRERVEQLVRSTSPVIEMNSLQSEIIEKKVQIHLQQMSLDEKKEERKTLYDQKEQEFIALRQEVQNERETEQSELIAKIKSLELLLKTQGGETEECADYFESESSNLMRAQRHILDMDRELRNKIRERREIENRLGSLNLQIELQAESSQEQFRDDLDELRQRAKNDDEEIEEMKRRFHTEADEYLIRLRRESFVVLEKNIVHSCFVHAGNMAVKEILKEIKFASHVPELAESYKSVTQDCSGWRYEVKERDVDLLKKESKDNNIHCFLGRGIIRASPHTISQAVSNPLSRFVYDRMLKSVRIVENIADELKIVYMLHETSHCFIKQSRDFCFVAFDKEKDGKLILACQSVEHPNCPEVKGIVRAKILSSGWVIEPITIEDKECSLVWYLTRVFLGSSLPSKLVNLVSKRQPLSIAYLREYLTSEK